MTSLHTWVMMLILGGLSLVLGCPAGDDDDSAADDDDSAGDDDDAATPPEISELSIYVAVPDGETDEMLHFAFDYTDAEGDILGGEIWLWTDGQFAGYATVEEQDAAEGSLLLYGDIGGDTGFPYGTYLFGIQLVDRAGEESNLLEQEYTLAE